MLLHLLGLAHNDIKPANILAEHGKSWQLHDFGITTPWSSQAPSNYQSRNGTPLYQYRNINKWQLCSPPLRDCFALCALMYEAIKNENVDPNDKRAYDIFMTREQTCTTFMDFVGVYARDLAQAQKLVDDEVAFFEQRVDSLVCSPLLKEAMKALLPVPKLARVKGTPARTNIFSAAQTFFGLDYADVMRSVASKYARYVSRVADSVRALP
jgi:serine/threonine protein kinase